MEQVNPNEQVPEELVQPQAQNLENKGISGVDISENIHMRKVKERYKDQLGSYEIKPIDQGENNLGYVLINSEKPPADGDWILSDLDDTLIGTQEVKPQRKQLFSTYFRNLGLDLSEEQVAEIINTTDQFSRWQEIEGGSKDYYHPIAHMVAMQQVTNSLVEAKKQGSTDSIEDILGQVYAVINRIKLQLKNNSEYQPGDPFRFNKDKKFVITKLPPWSNDIATIFSQTMVAPPTYEKNINAVIDDDLPESDHNQKYSVNKGIFTSGIPSYQLHKLGELMKSYPELRPCILLFTKVAKEEFLKKFIEQEGISGKTIIVYDDSVENIETLERMGLENQEQSGNKIIGIVAKTPYAKDANQKASLTTIDYESTEQDEIKKTLRNAIDNGGLTR